MVVFLLVCGGLLNICCVYERRSAKCVYLVTVRIRCVESGFVLVWMYTVSFLVCLGSRNIWRNNFLSRDSNFFCVEGEDCNRK